MYVKRKIITLKTAKVKEHASDSKIVIIQVHIKEIAIRHSHVMTKLMEQVKMMRKRLKKLMLLKIEPKKVVKCRWQTLWYPIGELC